MDPENGNLFLDGKGAATDDTLAEAQDRTAAVEARETELRWEVTRLTERLVAAAEEEARAADAVAALEVRGGRECTPAV